MANKSRKKNRNVKNTKIGLKDPIKAKINTFKPSIEEMLLSGRRTLNILKAAKFTPYY